MLGKFLREESLYPTSARFYYQLANLKRGRLILVGKGSRARSPLSVNVNHSHGKHHALASAFNPAAYLLCAWESSHASTIVRYAPDVSKSEIFFTFYNVKWNSRNLEFNELVDIVLKNSSESLRRGWNRFLFLQLNFNTVFLIRITMQKFYETSITFANHHFWIFEKSIHFRPFLSIFFFFFFFIWNNSSVFSPPPCPKFLHPRANKRKSRDGSTYDEFRQAEANRRFDLSWNQYWWDRARGDIFFFFLAIMTNLECFILFAGNSIRLIGSRKCFPTERELCWI